MKNILIITSSTRPGRVGDKVSNWVLEKAQEYEGNLSFDLVDLKTINLPFYDELAPPMMDMPHIHEHTRLWSQMVAQADGYIIITPEYNHGYPATLKNALDFLYKEWRDKKVGLVGYGGSGARNSVRQLKEVLSFMTMKPLDSEVGISDIWDAFDENDNLLAEKINGDINAIFSNLDV